ncbi:hypothetical protein [Paraburkholderia sp.]|uniref:hypothetical protein n=1 Tax=Paraburkholderia sp. TaxID=1926495 RepID=UPI0039E32C83
MPDKLIQNTDIMQSIITSALAFLASDRDRETREWFDLTALISRCATNMRKGDAAIHYDGPEQIRFFCRPEEISTTISTRQLHELNRRRRSGKTSTLAILAGIA